MILASEAFKKATALEEEKVLQETEEMTQEIATLIEEAISRGETLQTDEILKAVETMIDEEISCGRTSIVFTAHEAMIKEVEKIFTDLGYECGLEINYFNNHLLNIRIGY